MIKNLTTNQMVLIVIATVLLLLAAVSFYLLQDPMAALPFAPAPGTSSSTPSPPALAIIPSQTALTPTRQTSYTPRSAFITPDIGTPVVSPVVPGTTTPPSVPITTASPLPTNTLASGAITPSTSSPTLPGASTTLSPGEYGVTGRVVQNGTPVANVVVEFVDDVAPRKATTNSGGHYWFITLAPGTNFTLTFNQPDNLKLTPTAEVASLAWIEGSLPTNVETSDLPDFEVSINLNGNIFELQTPVDGAAYSASATSQSTPLQFNWSLYSLGGTYRVQVGPSGSDVPTWSSSQLAATSYMWNGTLDDGTHITHGTYWWRVSVTKSLGNYVLAVFTQQFDLLLNP